MTSKFNRFTQKISDIFSHKNYEEKNLEGKKTHKRYTRLNFYLLTYVLNHMDKGKSKKPQLLFTKEILNSKNKNLTEMIKHAELACSKQDLHLMSYSQFFLRNDLGMKRIVKWKLSKYLKEEDQIRMFIKTMNESPPDIFKRYLITLVNENKDSILQDKLEKGLEHQEKNWKHYQLQRGLGKNTVSKI